MVYKTLLVPALTVISLVGKVDSTKKKKDKIKCLQVMVSLKETYQVLKQSKTEVSFG